MRIKAYSRDERKSQIISVFAIELQHHKEPKMTMYAMAKRLNMSPSNHLTKILKELVAGGLLECSQEIHRPGVNKSMWSLKQGTWAYPQKQQRLVTVSMGGKKMGEFLI